MSKNTNETYLRRNNQTMKAENKAGLFDGKGSKAEAISGAEVQKFPEYTENNNYSEQKKAQHLRKEKVMIICMQYFQRSYLKPGYSRAS